MYDAREGNRSSLEIARVIRRFNLFEIQIIIATIHFSLNTKVRRIFFISLSIKDCYLQCIKIFSLIYANNQLIILMILSFPACPTFEIDHKFTNSPQQLEEFFDSCPS